MKFEPLAGWLLVSPIEEPSEKNFIEIAGIQTGTECAVIEKAGPDCSPRMRHGNVVYFARGVTTDVVLDRSVVFKLVHESQLRGIVEDPGEVKRTNVTPEYAKKFLEQKQADFAAAQRRAALEAGVNA
jgi:hypothetical protein